MDDVFDDKIDAEDPILGAGILDEEDEDELEGLGEVEEDEEKEEADAE